MFVCVHAPVMLLPKALYCVAAFSVKEEQFSKSIYLILTNGARRRTKNLHNRAMLRQEGYFCNPRGTPSSLEKYKNWGRKARGI